MARYQELDSLNPVSKHDPDFDRKRFEYINKTGIDPVTNKKADKALKEYAKNYTTFAPSIKAGYDFLMVGVAAWNMNAYKKELQAQQTDKVNKVFQDAADADVAKKVDGYDRTKDYYRKKFEFYGDYKEPLQFSNPEKLNAHYKKHGDEFNGLYSNPVEYLNGANEVVKNGLEVEYQYKGQTIRGFVRFIGNDSKGNSKFEFVGLTADGDIATYHTKSGKNFWKLINNGEYIKNINSVK